LIKLFIFLTFILKVYFNYSKIYLLLPKQKVFIKIILIINFYFIYEVLYILQELTLH